MILRICVTQGIEDGRVNIDSVFATISESSWALKKKLHKTHISHLAKRKNHLK